MGMANSTSGRCGYGSVEYSLTDEMLNVDSDMIEKMIIRENELRLSQTIQNKYKLYNNNIHRNNSSNYECKRDSCSDHTASNHISVSTTGYILVTQDLQKQVAREFGFDEETGMKILQQADKILLYKEDYNTLQRINNISLYRKYNRMYDNNLSCNDSVPNTNLYSLQQNTMIRLFNTDYNNNNKKYAIIVAGSIS